MVAAEDVDGGDGEAELPVQASISEPAETPASAQPAVRLRKVRRSTRGC
jgi:hypothetical protein